MNRSLEKRLEALEEAQRPKQSKLPRSILVYGPDGELLSEWRYDAAHPFGYEALKPEAEREPNT